MLILQENSGVTALTYSQDTLFLASGHQNGFVNIWKGIAISRMHHIHNNIAKLYQYMLHAYPCLLYALL